MTIAVGAIPFPSVTRDGELNDGFALRAPQLCRECKERRCRLDLPEAEQGDREFPTADFRTCSKGADFVVCRTRLGNAVLAGLWIPGLHQRDKSRAVKKQLQSQKLEMVSVQNWIAAHDDLGRQVQTAVEAGVRESLEMFHDVQTTASTIIRSGERFLAEQPGWNEEERFQALSPSARTLVKSAELLELRMRTMPIVVNPSAASYGARIAKPIYRLVHRLVRVLQPVADQKRVAMVMNGTSQRQMRIFESFDLLPLTLLENAIKYSASDQTVTVSVSDTPGGVNVSVESFSPWIPPLERQKIFERRVRGDAARRLAAPGSGLGLSIAESVAVAHGTHVFHWTNDGNSVLNDLRYAVNRFQFSLR